MDDKLIPTGKVVKPEPAAKVKVRGGTPPATTICTGPYGEPNVPFGNGDVVTNVIATYGLIVRAKVFSVTVSGGEAESVTEMVGVEVVPVTQVAEITPAVLIANPVGKPVPVQV